MIIAIDGHSACGKSTLAKDISKHLQIVYIDSGAMYRAVTLYLLTHHVDIRNSMEVTKSLPDIHIEFVSGDLPIVLLNHQDVTERIRSTDISEWVSELATISTVRKRMVELQQRISKDKSVVMDGRDIGSVVFPDADYKFFLTANIQVRSQRRYDELKAKGIQVTIREIEENLIKRDYIDSNRADSPLIQCPDAIVIDNSTMNRQEQLKIALDYIHKS